MDKHARDMKEQKGDLIQIDPERMPRLIEEIEAQKSLDAKVIGSEGMWDIKGALPVSVLKKSFSSRTLLSSIYDTGKFYEAVLFVNPDHYLKAEDKKIADKVFHTLLGIMEKYRTRLE